MFCERGQAELIRQVAAHVKERGRLIQRGKNRRYFAKDSVGFGWIMNVAQKRAFDTLSATILAMAPCRDMNHVPAKETWCFHMAKLSVLGVKAGGPLLDCASRFLAIWKK